MKMLALIAMIALASGTAVAGEASDFTQKEATFTVLGPIIAPTLTVTPTENLLKNASAGTVVDTITAHNNNPLPVTIGFKFMNPTEKGFTGTMVNGGNSVKVRMGTPGDKMFDSYITSVSGITPSNQEASMKVLLDESKTLIPGVYTTTVAAYNFYN